MNSDSPISHVSAPPAGFQLKNKELAALVQDMVTWSNQHGLVVALKDPAYTNPEMAVIHAPLACMPVPFPRQRFLQAKAVMPIFNQMVDRVASDEAYLENTLAAAATFDEFTKQLLQVLRSTRQVRQARADQELALGVHRSDYMLDEPSGCFLQVELNTIASSFGCLSSLTTQLHTYICSKAPGMDPSLLPPNAAKEGIAAALAAAVKAHGAADGVMVMIVQPGERNAYDQQWLQLELWERHRVRTLRCSLQDIAVEAELSPEGAMSIRGSPVSLVYFRAGYTPVDYPSQQEWKARELIETSNAAKCPTVAYQLAGTKKVQQDLATPGVLERFTATPQEARQIRGFFAGLWSLDNLQDPSTADVVAEAIRNPEAFVLKPQREGGGNNLYGDELVEKLRAAEGLSAFILMQKILPPRQRSVLVRNGEWREADTVSELGIYGTFLRRGKQQLLNEEVGHLVRTKASDSNEGGVASGFAVLDSPYLLD